MKKHMKIICFLKSLLIYGSAIIKASNITNNTTINTIPVFLSSLVELEIGILS